MTAIAYSEMELGWERVGDFSPEVTLWLLVLQIALKYDPQIEEDLRNWIEEVTGLSIGPNFQLGLKDGIILCE